MHPAHAVLIIAALLVCAPSSTGAAGQPDGGKTGIAGTQTGTADTQTGRTGTQTGSAGMQSGSAGSQATPAPSPFASFESQWKKELSASGVVGASYAVFDTSSVLRSAGYGWADREKRAAAGSFTPYLIGSLTKLFTAVGVLRLADQGLVDIDEPVTAYLPDFTLLDGGGGITVRQVLTHHAGLPSDIYAGKFSPTPARFELVVPYLAGQRSCSPPGMVYSYSNVGFALLGVLIERVSGMDYESFIEAEILRPLGMDDTWFFHDIAEADRMAAAYDQHGLRATEYPLYDVPAGAIVSTVDDLARFGQALISRDGRLLSPGMAAEMVRPQNLDVALDLDDTVGLAFTMSRKGRENGTVVEHGGATIYQRAQLYLAPDLGVGGVVLSNSPSGTSNAWRLNEDLFIALGKERAFAAPAGIPPLREMTYAALDTLDLPSFAGTYAGPGVVFSFRWSKQRLYASIQGQTFFLLPKDAHAFVPALDILGITLPSPDRYFFLEEVDGRKLFLEGMPWGDAVLTAVKADPSPVSGPWRAMFGRYPVANARPGELVMINDVELAMSEGFVVLRFRQNPVFGDAPAAAFALELLSDTEAHTLGLGRGAGESLHILPAAEAGKPRFSFMGLELERY